MFHRAAHDMDFYRNLGDWILSLSKNDHVGCEGSRVVIEPLSTTYRRQSSKGYTHDGRLYKEVHKNKNKMVTETQD